MNQPYEPTEKAKELLNTMGHTCMAVTMKVVAPPDASLQDVLDYLYELECAGGCRDPQDPLFDSIGIIDASTKTIRRPRGI